MLKEIVLTKESKKGYLISGSVYTFGFLAWVILAILWWHEPDNSSKDIFYLLVFLINIPATLITSVANFYNSNHEKIILSENGITYKTFGTRIFTPWNRLNHIEEDGGLFYTGAKYHLDKPEYIPVRKEDVSRKFYAWIVNYKNIIPLSNFGNNWRNTILGEILKEKVPHLFDV